jgi:uncharacterized protein (TIGR03437 family)
MNLKARLAVPVAFVSVFMGSAWSQTPVVTGVVNTGLLDTNFAPSSLVYIFGTFPQGAGRNFSITVGGQTGEVTVADNTVFITAEIPTNAPLGAQTLTVNYEGLLSNAFPIMLAAYAPELGNTPVTVSSSTSQPVFGPSTPFYHSGTGLPVSAASPAQPGEPLIAYTSGLGQTNPPTTGLPPATFTPLAATPTISVSSLPATIARSGSGGPEAEVDFFVPNNAPLGIDPVVLTIGGVNSNTASLPVQTQSTTFFTGEAVVGGSVYYLQFPNKNVFGYYSFVTGSILYHYDMGFEAVVLSNDAQGGVYLYDFTSGHWLYSNPSLFPYLYDFTLTAWLYYIPATNDPGHYTSNPRYFSNLTTGKIITM